MIGTVSSDLLAAHPGAVLVDDSREVQPGSIFFAYPGRSTDGREFIPAAIKAKAAGVLWEQGSFEWQPSWQIANEPHIGLRARAGQLAAMHFGFPAESLGVVAVTGTKGKTTTAWFIAQLLAATGKQAGYAGTIGIKYPHTDELAQSSHTTLPSLHMHRVLAEFVEQRAQAAVIEASSQGIEQGRLAGINCPIGVITNIGHDHLDYHGTAGQYLAAKRKLFMKQEMQWAVANADDENCLQAVAGSAATQLLVGKDQDADLRWEKIDLIAGGQKVCFHWQGQAIEFDLMMPGEFNIANAAFAFAAAAALGSDMAQLTKAVGSLQPPPGRLQRVAGGGCAVYVDYAHTAESISAALASIREQGKDGKVICVFGCGGNRDPSKRAPMGKAASAADHVIITTDNPRDEDPAAIAAQAAGGISGSYDLVLDRRDAIRTAISLAGSNDSVLIAGKGHESAMIGPAGQISTFSDYAEAQAALKELA